MPSRLLRTVVVLVRAPCGRVRCAVALSDGMEGHRIRRGGSIGGACVGPLVGDRISLAGRGVDNLMLPGGAWALAAGSLAFCGVGSRCCVDSRQRNDDAIQGGRCSESHDATESPGEKGRALLGVSRGGVSYSVRDKNVVPWHPPGVGGIGSRFVPMVGWEGGCPTWLGVFGGSCSGGRSRNSGGSYFRHGAGLVGGALCDGS